MHRLTAHSPVQQRLILCVDGVPYSAVERLYAQGHFARFHRPSRMIAPFPTMTNVALKDLFGAASPAGYEAFYFDRSRNRLTGGALSYLQRRAETTHIRTYHHFVDYQEPIHFEFLVYVMPERIFQADLERFLTAFRAHTGSQFVGYLKSTDGLIHMGGRQKLDWALRLLDETLEGLVEAHRGRLEIILFSDHGNSTKVERYAPLKAHLRHRYLTGSRLHSSASIVIPEFGLATFAAIYTTIDPDPVARDATQLEGVDFAIYRREDTIVIVNGTGTAEMTYDRARRAYRYEPHDADPLNLHPLIERLQEREHLDGEGFAGDRAWFEITSTHEFPDILYRLHQAMDDQVENRADILLSFRDGVYAGHGFFEGFVDLMAIHGNARMESSTGFLMSTHRPYPPCLRASDVPAYLALA